MTKKKYNNKTLKVKQELCMENHDRALELMEEILVSGKLTTKLLQQMHFAYVPWILLGTKVCVTQEEIKVAIEEIDDYLERYLKPIDEDLSTKNGDNLAVEQPVHET